MEFVIEQKQRAVVDENFNRIQELFNVQIVITNGTAEKVWITLKGGQEEKAKSYIQALTNPVPANEVAIPASLIKTFGPRTSEHFKLESEYGVVIRFPQDTKAVIRANNAMNAMLATSKLEALIANHSGNTTQVKPEPKANRTIEDFALKLGYEQEQINTVFEKLGPTIDKNTFLKELINISGARSRIADDRWLPVSPQAAGMLPSTGMNSQMYGTDSGVVARGVSGRSSVTTAPSNSSQSYVNRDFMPYNRDLGIIPLHSDGVARGYIPRTTGALTQGNNSSGVISRGFTPRTTAPSTQGSCMSPSNVISRGFIPRTTSQTTQGNNSTYSSSEWPNGIYAQGYIPRTTGALTQGNNSSGVISRGFTPRTTAPSTQGSCMSPSNVISRGFIPRTTSQTTQGNNSTYSSSEWPNGSYLAQGSEYVSNSEPQQVDQLVYQMMSKYQQLPQSDLRHVVIDGSNVAMSHGNNKIFSCRGIALCVDWFRKRGHKQITVFVPSWRKESPKVDNPITDQHILNQLEAQGCLTFTPSRKINGRRIVCYDDRFIVKLANSTDGIIVSNDNFKDLASENPKWREVIEQRLLMYSFVNDMFMPPDDPLGRHGPNLDEFLHKGTKTHRRVCPYGRRCTYGTRCKYHHPEREDYRLPIYQSLQALFPNQEVLIVSVMKKYPQEKDADKLASHILSMNMMH